MSLYYMSLFIFTLRQVNEGGEMFGGKHKTIPFQFKPINKTTQDFFSFLPVWEYFSYLLWILGYLANVHITNWESEIKTLKKNKIFKRTSRGCSWLPSQHTKPIISLNLFVRVLERTPYLEKASKSSWPEQWNKDEEMHYFYFNFKKQLGHSSRVHFRKLYYG